MGGKRNCDSANQFELYPLPGVTKSPGMHPIAQYLPVGPLISPFTIIIASITQPDTRKQNGEWEKERDVREKDKEKETGEGDKEAERDEGGERIKREDTV